MRFQLTIGEEQTYLEPSQPFTDGEGVHHPCNVLTLWSDEELAAIGVAKVADAPPVPPAEVPMYKVTHLLITMGLLGAVEAALDDIPGVEGEVARSNWQRAPNLVRTDPLVQGMAAQLGFDLDALILAADALP